MKKPTKVAVAAALGASLLISGSTYALWSSSVNPGTAASILTGDSAINALDAGAWTDLVQKQPIADINSFRAAPGDELGFQQDFNVKFSGGATMKNKLQLKFADDSGLDPSSLKARGIIVQATLTDLDSGKTSTSDLNTSSLTTGFTFTGSLPKAGDRVRVSVNFKINSDVSAEDTKKLQSLVSSSQLNIYGVVDPKAETVSDLEYPVNKAFSYQLKATGTPAPTWSLVSGTLPAGVTLSPSGLISGTPTGASQSTITARATNDAGSVDVKFNLSVVEPVVFQTTSLPDFSVNVPYSEQLIASGNPTFAVTSGALPQGLTLSSSGLISGLPTTNANAQAAFTITATGANGSASKSFVVNLVTPQFGMSNPVGYEYIQQVIPMNITGLGKDSDLTVAFTNNTSPSPYIQISGTNLVLTSNLRAGAYSFGLTASNKTGAVLTKGYTVNVKASSTVQWSNNSTITAASVANSPRYYNFQFYYNPSTTITVKSGALPDGVTIDPSGKIYGYMKTSGTYTAVLQSGAQTMTVKFVG